MTLHTLCSFLIASLLTSANMVASTPHFGAYGYLSHTCEHPKAILVCLHDVWANRSMFDRFGQSLASKYDVSIYSLEQSGYEKQASQIDIIKTEAAIQGLIHALDKQYGELPVFLLGEGVGGALALDYCCSQNLPKNVAGLILINLPKSGTLSVQRCGKEYQVACNSCSSDYKNTAKRLLFSKKEIVSIRRLLSSQESNAANFQLSKVLLVVGRSIEPRNRENCEKIFLDIHSLSKEFWLEDGNQDFIESGNFGNSIIDKLGEWLTRCVSE